MPVSGHCGACGGLYRPPGPITPLRRVDALQALDQAVAETYGWGDDWLAGKLTDDEILARQFRLNQEKAQK